MIEQNAKNHPDLGLKVDQVIRDINTSLARSKLNLTALTMSAAYSQTEVQALADQIKTIADKLDSLLL